MVHAEDSGSGRRVRRWRSVSEKRQIVQITMEPGASVAEVARAGLNANQVFKWRRAFELGELTEPYAALLPVTVPSLSEPEIEPSEQRPETRATSSGSIHIELPGRAMISVESGADHVLIRAILRVSGSDPTPHRNEDLDCGRSDRYAPRL
jgi:transposase